MQIGYIGLGKMGKNMVLRLLEKGHDIVAWNRSEEPRNEVSTKGAKTTKTVEELVRTLGSKNSNNKLKEIGDTKKIVWIMLPAGKITNDMIDRLGNLLSENDIVINGANSFYKDAIKHNGLLKQKGIRFIDVGISGGPSGARNGACVMVGSSQQLYQELEPLFKDIAAENAYRHFEGVGAGHFVKMVHNGIEYGMMQSIAEGFAIMKNSQFDLDLVNVAKIYNNQSVIESRLIGWMQSGFEKFGADLESISGSAGSGGSGAGGEIKKSEGAWTVQVAHELGINDKVIHEALNARLESSKNPNYQGKIINTLRNQFGGHDASENKN